MLVVVRGCHDQIHQMLVLWNQEILHCTQKNAATTSREGMEATRACADGVGDIFGGRQRAEDAIVDNQWQAVKARESRHFGRETQKMRNASRFGGVAGEIVEMVRVAVFAVVLPYIRRENRGRLL